LGGGDFGMSGISDLSVPEIKNGVHFLEKAGGQPSRTFRNHGLNLADVPAMDFIQWPAMCVTITAAWFVSSSSRARRKIGFWLFLLSNVLWVTWGVSAHAYALIVLQVGLAIMNIRGERKNTA
jgi:hypothetical protein